MAQIAPLLIAHGFLLIFVVVFLEQIGLPLPSTPWLLATGALWFTGQVNGALILIAAVIACLIADAIWFHLGRRRGNQVLRLLCRISLEPDSCVRRTQNAFSRYGAGAILAGKFIPGFGGIAPPLAGMNGFKASRFLFLDGIGITAYCSLCFLLGYLFHNQITALIDGLTHVGGSLIRVVAVLLALYIAYKYCRRQMLLHKLKMARITIDELYRLMDAGNSPMILDVRSLTDLKSDAYMIRGAIHVSLDELATRQDEFSRDQEIVVYCSCPNEASAAKAALHFHRRGFKRVRPLQGGIEAWRKKSYPLDEWTAVTIHGPSLVQPSSKAATP